MKRYKLGLLAFIALFLFSCEKETEGLSKVTYFCNLSLVGAPVIFVSSGGAFNDPGWVADENGEDISNKVEITGSVNTSTPGEYRLVYSVSNADGFTKTAVRRVFVYDATPSAMKSGIYNVSPASNRNGTTMYGGAFTILINQVAPGRFYVSDLFGGYYDQRAAYGSAFAMVGQIALSGANVITLLSSKVQGWGDSLDGLVDGSCDPDTQTVKWTAQYVGAYDFNVIATPQ